jgi:hypothetical protein
MEEATEISNLLLGGGTGAGGGVIGGFLLSRFLASRNAASGPSNEDLGAKIDRTNELLTELLMGFSEMKGLLAAMVQRD